MPNDPLIPAGFAFTLISLETGVASGPDFSLPWNGTQYPIEPWNRDQTLRSAFSVSCLWFYQELARRVGSQRMNEFVTKIRYGNCDTSGGITNFATSGFETINQPSWHTARAVHDQWNWGQAGDFFDAGMVNERATFAFVRAVACANRYG